MPALPVLLDPYGGPHAQRVQQARSLFHASQWFADQGFAVLVTDGRGTPGPRHRRSNERCAAISPGRSSTTRSTRCSGRRGSSSPAWISSRVAIRGWSFGGYLAALAVLRRPDVFHAAVAGAPVTDWRLYDTHYTERYLGHPDEEPENYVRCDLTAEVGGLEPATLPPLMLIHGLADDNVVAAHTLQLSRALLEAGQPHTVLPLSGVTHMTPQEEVAENSVGAQLAFLREVSAHPEPGAAQFSDGDDHQHPPNVPATRAAATSPRAVAIESRPLRFNRNHSTPSPASTQHTTRSRATRLV